MSGKGVTGTMIIKPGKISHTILKWMQSHEGKLKKTTGQKIAESIAALDDVESGEVIIAQVISKMVGCNVIYRDKYPGKVYSDFRINYWHKSIPADILSEAPIEVKRAMAKTLDSMQANQYMDDEGCVVTPNSVEKSEDPFTEDEPEKGTFENPIEDEVLPWEEGYEEDGTKTYTNTNVDDEGSGQVDIVHVPEEKQQVSVPVEVKKDGKSMSITVNLTINL